MELTKPVDNRLLINRPVQGIDSQVKRINEAAQERKGKTSFKEVLAGKLQEQTGVKFSKHARERLISRQIKVNEADLQRLKLGVEKAAEKGSRDSLILVNQVAYLVSIENRTVITAVDDQHVKENVFTNIDSAVFM